MVDACISRDGSENNLNESQSIKLCFCLQTTHICSVCKNNVCDFCSPDAEEASLRHCRTCFAEQIDDSNSDVENPKKSLNTRALNLSSESQGEEASKYPHDDLEEVLEHPEPLTEINNNTKESKPFKVVKDSLGREHVATKKTGVSHVFMKSHNHKPSTMQEHVNDITAILMARVIKPKILVIKADDGDDYSIRSQHNIHLLGRLWYDMDLDMLVFIKNAPGDSKYNEVEHLWGYITRKLAGIVLSKDLSPEELDDYDPDLEEKDDFECRTVMNRAVIQASNFLQGLKFDLNVVPITTETKTVLLGEKEVNLNTYNDFENIKDLYKLSRKQLAARGDLQGILKEAKLFHKHVDSRTRSVIFRKCCPLKREVQCQSCKQRPIQAQDAMQVLPARLDGGLFFYPTPDEKYASHHETFMEKIKKKHEKVIPDGMLEEVKKCDIDKCFNVFKNKTDAERHDRIFHDDPGLRQRIDELFEGLKCKFKDDEGNECGLVFSSKHYLQKHRKNESHPYTKPDKKSDKKKNKGS